MLKLIFVVLIIFIIVLLVMILFFGIKSYHFSSEKKQEEKPFENDAVVLQMMQKTVRALANAIEAKDSFTLGHSQRVANYAKEIASRMKLSEADQQNIYFSGLLHDVGKIRVPDTIIKKTGKYSESEFSVVRLHPVTGYRILKGVSNNSEIENAVKYHHEHFDGTGYPEGLKGKQIPLFSRILRVADTYDAMTSDRSFRNIYSQDYVRAEIQNGLGREFDPEIGSIMLQMIDEDKMYSMKQNEVPAKKILIIDDDKIYRKLIESMLKKDGVYCVFTAKSGEEALKIVDEIRFDLIILDSEMPKMNGLEFLRKIKIIDDVKIILMVADKNIETLVKANEFGVKYYLMKPFLKQELNEAIRSTFN